MKVFLRDVDDIQLYETDEEENWNFNEDLLCEHNSLRILDSKRKIVPLQAWLILKTYFPNCNEYPSNALACSICEVYIIYSKYFCITIIFYLLDYIIYKFIVYDKTY
jgi:hypothetical protein